jgi:hypothetical protein
MRCIAALFRAVVIVSWKQYSAGEQTMLRRSIAV